MMIRQPKTYVASRFYKHQKLKEQAKHFWLRCCRVRTGLMKDMLRRALVNQHKSRKQRGTVALKLRNDRLDAACAEHDINQKELKAGLISCRTILSNKMLTTMSIYEPLTFKSLVEVSQRAQIERNWAKHVKLPDRRLTVNKPVQKLTKGVY